MTSPSPHIPVLMQQILEGFEPTSIKIMVDGTLGAGGHASAILENHPEIELFIGIDQDPEALKIAEKNLEPWKSKVILKHGNFSQLDQILKELSIKGVDGILVDIGVSSMQLDQASRGFSFMRNGPLDMRMNPENPLTAEIVINEWSEDQLGRIFREYGEEKKWRLAANAIIQARKNQRIQTTTELVEVLKSALGQYSKKGFHPATLVFQAIRICVNKELEVLENFLPKATDYLNKDGRLAVISFHRLEDRIVKSFTRQAADDKWDTSGIGGLFQDKQPTVKLITKKPLEASEEECRLNPRSRSAKLRIIQKLENK
ncbi:MAG: 16S rRNA (cytosine(1402)-N(4))-methyltransferase RsmH [Parachlamydiaceae bacterium]|nr:16S rRNA (cytosine(1402)-N(4))-methyltransferase RsmH [Parachlamydiaceae bacterium]